MNDFADLTPRRYPRKNIQSTISNYFEFAEGSNSLLSDTKSYYRSLRHQTDVINYFTNTQIKNMLIYMKPGRGKTVIMGLIAEFFREEYLQSLSDSINISRVRGCIVLTTGENQRNGFIDIIVCVCNPGYTRRDNGELATSRKTLNKSFKKWYEFKTYRKFAKRIYQKEQDLISKYEQIFEDFEDDQDVEDTSDSLQAAQEEFIKWIKEEYSHKYICLDELHNFRCSKSQLEQILDYNKTLSDLGNIHVEDDFKGDAESENSEESDKAQYSQRMNKLQVIRAILIILDNASGVRVIVSDATPMVDTPEDFKTILFMLCTHEERKEIVNLNMEVVEARDLSKYLEGKVSFVGELSNRAVAEYMGNIYNAQANNKASVSFYAYVCYMSAYQSEKYMKVYNKSQLVNDIYISSKQSSIIVSPKPYSIEFVVKTANGHHLSDELINYLGGVKATKDVKLANLKKISTIFYEIMEILSDSYFETTQIYDTLEGVDVQKNARVIPVKDKQGNRKHKVVTPFGVIAVYYEYVEGNGGIILLGLLLEFILGYERFKAKSGISTGSKSGFCTTSNTIINPELESSKLRYCLLHSNIPVSLTETTKAILKSGQNMTAKYIRVVLMSGAAREGVSIYNALGYIPVGSEWTPSDNEQAEGRVFREDSADYLREYITLTDFGKPEKSKMKNTYYDKNDRLKVRVYKLSAVPVIDEEPDQNKSVHFQIAISVESKKSSIDRLADIIASLAFDYHLQPVNKVKPYYGKIKEIKGYYYNNTLNKMRSQYMNAIEEKIYQHLKDNPDLNISYLSKKIVENYGLSNNMTTIVGLLIDEAINSGTIIKGNKFGHDQGLLKTGDYAYLSNKGSETFYSHNLIVTRPISGTSIKANTAEINKIFSSIKNNDDPTDEEILAVFLKNVRDKVNKNNTFKKCLELFYSQDITENRYINSLLRSYRAYYYHTKYPSMVLDHINNRNTGKNGPKQGRKPKRVVAQAYTYFGKTHNENETKEVIISMFSCSFTEKGRLAHYLKIAEKPEVFDMDEKIWTDYKTIPSNSLELEKLSIAYREAFRNYINEQIISLSQEKGGMNKLIIDHDDRVVEYPIFVLKEKLREEKLVDFTNSNKNSGNKSSMIFINDKNSLEMYMILNKGKKPNKSQLEAFYVKYSDRSSDLNGRLINILDEIGAVLELY